MKRRGRLFALWAMVSASGTLAAAGIAIKDRVLEEWYVWKLEKGCVEERVAAAKRLGETRSVRAVRPLLAAMERECVRSFGPTLSGEYFFGAVSDCETTETFLEAFANIGHPAMLELIRALTNGKHFDSERTTLVASFALDRVYRDGQRRIPSGGVLFLIETQPLLQAIQDDLELNEEVREAAAETLSLLGRPL